MDSYMLWAVKESGETNSESFGVWVSVDEAVMTLREDYPETVAILSPLTNEVIWIASGYSVEV